MRLLAGEPVQALTDDLNAQIQQAARTRDAILKRSLVSLMK